MKRSVTDKEICDYRRLKWCPKCGGWSEAHVGERQGLRSMTHKWKNWNEVQERQAERAKTWIGPPPPEIELQTLSFQCLCPVCGWYAYYLADTGERCDSRGRKMRKHRGRKRR